MSDQAGVSGQRTLALRAVPDAAPQARSLLRDQLAGTPLEDRLDDGLLAISELITNAVLHGRDPIEVTVTVTATCARAEVSDGSPVSPSFSMLDPTAVTGRGLMLISSAADRWGVEPRPDGKSVWFELFVGGRDDGEADVDALLAAWGDDLVEDPAHEQVRVVLTDLQTELVARSEAHIEGVLRELHILIGCEEADPEHTRIARAVLQAAALMEPVRNDLRHQVAVAVSAGQPRVDVSVTLQREDAELVRDFVHAIDEADRLSRSGVLLTAPAPAELSAVRQTYLRRLLAQLTS